MKDKNSDSSTVKGATYTTEASASATKSEEEVATPDPADGAERFSELLARSASAANSGA